MPEFPCTAPLTAVVDLAAGALDIVAEERDSAVVDVQPYDGSEASREQAEQTRVDLSGDTLTVSVPERVGRLFRLRSGGVRIRIRIPLDSSARVKQASANARLQGRYANLSVDTASGELDVEHVTGAATVRTASGNVQFGRVDGRLEVNGASGELTARQVGGPVRAHLASGDIEIAEAGAGVDAKTASGDVQIGLVRQGRIRIGTASGEVAVGVRAGTGVWLDLNTVSGNTRNGLDMAGSAAPNGAELNLEIRTVSGDIEVRRAA